MANELETKLTTFLHDVTAAMGLSLRASIEHREDHIRVNLEGSGGEVLLRRKAEALDALQHLVNTVFRRASHGELHFVVDCFGYRRTKEAELTQMTTFLMERAKTTREQQEIGPLNPFHRRLVHLTVASDPALASESVGDAFMKTLIISLKK
jgi:spoIIIJ-associated protein